MKDWSHRVKNFEKGSDYNKTWKASEDGKVNTNGPRVMVDQGNGSGPTGGYITRSASVLWTLLKLY